VGEKHFTGEGKNPDIVAHSMKYNRNVFLDDAMPQPDKVNAVARKVPAHVHVNETGEFVTLRFTVDEAVLNAGYPNA